MGKGHVNSVDGTMTIAVRKEWRVLALANIVSIM